MQSGIQNIITAVTIQDHTYNECAVLLQVKVT